MIHTSLLDRQLVFVSGKGGTGKTTISAALADLAARRGQRVLVCEMDAKGSLAAAFEVASLGFEPTEVEPGLSAMTMNTEDSLREYLRLFVRIPFVSKIGMLARTFDFVADAAPGVKEILAIGKLCFEVRERHYDLVIVDAEASGHIVGQIDAPRAIHELVKVGLVREQTEWMLEILDDPHRTGLVVVATPEEMPVTETIELVTKVQKTTQVDVAAIIANRVLPQWFAESEGVTFDALAQSEVQQMLIDAVGGKNSRVPTVFRAAQLAQSRHAIAAAHLRALRTGIAARFRCCSYRRSSLERADAAWCPSSPMRSTARWRDGGHAQGTVRSEGDDRRVR